MRKIVKLALILTMSIVSLAVFSSGQVVPLVYQGTARFTVANNCGASDHTNTCTGFNITGSGAQYHQLVINTSGTVTTCAGQIDSSVDGLTWSLASVITLQNCGGNTNISVVSSPIVVNFVRINITTLTGGGVLNTVITGYANNPAGGGGGSVSLTCVAPLSCSPSTITGTGSVNVLNAHHGWPIYNGGAIPGALDASDIFFATSGNNCGTGVNEDVGCAINNALLSTLNTSNVISAMGFVGRWQNNILPINSQITHGFTGSNFTLIVPGYMLASVPQWGLRQKMSIIGTGIPYSAGVTPYGPALGACGPKSPTSAGYNATTHVCNPVGGGLAVPQFPDTTNAQTFGVKFNIPHGPIPAGSYYPLFIDCGMDASGEGSGFASDCIGNEVAHIAFDGGGNDTTNDPTLGTGLILFYSENIDVRDEWHDLIFSNLGASNAVNAVAQMLDRREAPTGQAGPARFSERDTNFTSNLDAPSISTYGLMYIGENLTIEFTQGSCNTLPSAIPLSATTAGVATYKITGNGVSGCAVTPPTCTSIQAGNSLSLVGNLVSNARNSSSTCTPVLTGGVVTSLIFGTGSGYNVAIVGTGPYSLADMSMTGNGNAYQDFIYIDGTANPVTTAIHGETGSGFTIHYGGHAAVYGGVANGTDGTAGIGGTIELDLGADGTQVLNSTDYIATNPGPAVTDLVNNCIVNGFIPVYTSGHACNPAVLDVNLGVQAVRKTALNDTSPGTQSFRVVKITSTGADTATNTDTAIDGIAVNGAGTTGSVQIAWGGTAPCAFINTTTRGDFVQVDSTGKCNDVGATFPTSGGAVVGKVTVTNGSVGTNNVDINISIPATAGSGISGLTTGFVPKAGSSTTIVNSLCDDGITTANTFTCSDSAGGHFTSLSTGTATSPGTGVIALPAGGSIQSADTGTPTLTYGTNKITASQPLFVNTIHVGLIIANGTSALATGAISSGTCASAITTTATNTVTTDVISWGFNGDPTGVTGYAPVTSGALTIFAYPSANNVNFKVCNLTTGSITPGAITLNWSVVR